MANGGYWHSEADWRRVEAPLLELDNDLSAFALRYSICLTKNHKDWPERSLRWGKGIEFLIQVYLADEAALTFNVWLCASQDRNECRYWKREFLVEGMPVTDFRRSFASLLSAARVKVESWSEDQLEFVTRLG